VSYKKEGFSYNVFLIFSFYRIHLNKKDLKQHKTYLLILFFALTQQNISAQRGGESLYILPSLTQSARIAAIGGNQVGITGNDLAMIIHNPAILDSSLSKQISLSFAPYIADISYMYAGFAWSFENIGTFALGLHHLDMGTLVGADESGIKTGDFLVGENVIQLNYSRQLSPRITAGISIKPINSRIENYNSWGIASDIGFIYRHIDGLLSAGITYRNFGQQLTSYHEEKTERLSSDLQFGVTKKLAHAPFRFSLTVQDILSGSLQYSIPTTGGSQVGTAQKDDNIAEKISKHLVIGLEFMPSQNFYVAAGVNPRRRQELKIESRTSTVGYTWGFGFKANRFHFSYGSSRYHLSGTSNHISISTNLNSF
jgi:hypothetical protein